MITTWPAPLGNDEQSLELLLAFDKGRERRLLVIPALFDEANKLRRFTVQVMRALDRAGIDSFLPDLPGQNESLCDLSKQSIKSWRGAASAAAAHVNATEILAIRAGAVMVPEGYAGTLYAPHLPKKQLRSMLRAQTISAREAGRDEKLDSLEPVGRADGLMLAGWNIGPEMFRELETADIGARPDLFEIEQKDLGGRGLWLRAEPDEDTDQAERLAEMIANRGAKA